MLKIYNSLTKRKQGFKPYNFPNVGFYTCGATVYHDTHIGHIRKYIGDDLIRRSLVFLGYNIKHVQNVTDVGHLVSDNDEGEDKMEKGSKIHKISVWELAKKLTVDFYSQMDLVNNLRPTVVQNASSKESIKSQISKIQLLVNKGYAYIADSAVYFDVSKINDYNPFSNQTTNEKIQGTRADLVTDPQKRNHADFALWVFTKGIHKNHTMRWESPWGTGFPGWHIECSAISLDNLNNQIDIHTGGIDHKEIHHPNEIAQNFGICGRNVVKYWIHHDFLLVNGSKMSKSLGNFYTLKDITTKGFSPLDLRYFILQAHYRSELNFTWDALKNASNGLKNLNRKIFLLRNASFKTSKAENYHLENFKQYKAFKKALEDDINIPRALAVVWETLDDPQVDNQPKMSLVGEFDKVLGLRLLEKNSVIIPKNIQDLAKKRDLARESKDYQKADALRDQILKLGFEVEDTDGGTKVIKI
jgi:cysteinyl-tRNA synthetase